MNEYIPLGDTRDLFRIAKFVKLIFFRILLLHSHSVICTSLLLEKNLRIFDVICVDVQIRNASTTTRLFRNDILNGSFLSLSL